MTGCRARPGGFRQPRLNGLWFGRLTIKESGLDTVGMGMAGAGLNGFCPGGHGSFFGEDDVPLLLPVGVMQKAIYPPFECLRIDRLRRFKRAGADAPALRDTEKSNPQINRAGADEEVVASQKALSVERLL